MKLPGGILIFWVIAASPGIAEEAVCRNTRYAIDAFHNKQYDRAVACLDYLIKKQPGNGGAHYLKGKYCLNIQDWDCVRKSFTAPAALARHGTEISEKLEKAYRSYFDAKNLKVALELYRLLPGFKLKDACSNLFRMGNSAKPDDGYMYYMLSREFCGSVNDQVIGKRFMDIARQKPVESRKHWLEMAAEFLTWDEIHSVFPPPVEKIVFEKTFDGHGLDDRHAIQALVVGKDVQRGDVIDLEGSRFLVSVEGRWVEAKGWFKITELALPEGERLHIAAARGVRVSVKARRTIISY